ncbi:MAG: response regulator [Vicinamibacterales bacterium]|nr:response regulator [Vicinamibacterales bacterium]
MSRRLIAVARSWPLADKLALLYGVVYTVWVFSHERGTPLNVAIANLAFLPLGLTVGAAYLRNAKLAKAAGLDLRTRIGWTLLAAGAFNLWVSGTAWMYFVDVTGPRGTPVWIDGLEYLQLLFVLAACLSFPTRPPHPRARARFWLDVAMMLVAAGALAVHYGMDVVAPWRQVLGLDLVMVRAILDWSVFFSFAVGVFHKRDATIRTVMLCLLVANVCVLTGNWLLSRSAVYVAGQPVDLLWFAAWGLRWAAARHAARRYTNHRVVAAERERSGERMFDGLPHVVVGAAFILLVYNVLTSPADRIAAYVYTTAALATLLVVRQVAELRENRRLFDAQLALEARFRSLVQHSSDVILVVGSNGRLTYVSPSVVQVLGDGSVRVGDQLAAVVHPDDEAQLSGLLERLSSDAEHVPCRMRTASGDWREIDVIASDMRADPDVDGIVLNCRDVTDRNELESRLHHAQKLDAVGHLAGGLAHDFNNVLTAIRGYTELLQGDVPPNSAAAADLHGIEQAVDRAAAVTKKLLAFSRKQAVQRTVIDLNVVVTDLAPLLRQLVTNSIEVRLLCAPDLWPVRADKGQLEQVLINLVANARDAMPDGGAISVSTSNRDAASLPAGTPPGDWVELVVRDPGVGMPAEIQKRIFEPFFSTKPKEKGMGLGLAMVHGIVTQSRGFVAVESEEGRGTTFRVLLPRSDGTPAALSAAPPVPERPAQARRILLVDDEAGVRAVVRRMLERAGFVVIEASSGPEALALLSREPESVDLLLTDLVMPGMHGRELIRRFRILHPDTPVVCMTGFAGESMDVHGLEAGIAAVVTKPFSSGALVRAVSAAMEPGLPGPVDDVT